VATTNRLLYITQKGYLGLGPPTAEIGDKIYIFEGGRVPFIIREKGFEDFDVNALRRYALIGDCYVQGMMDGKGMGANEAKESIRLR
jgi:hypothetical protein